MFDRIKQLDRQTKLTLVLAAVIGILLFGAITGGIRQAGWNEGFLAGLLTNGGENMRAVTPPAAYQGGTHSFYSRHGWGGHPFGFIGGFFRFLFFGFLLMIFFKVLGFWRWRMHGGHSGGHPWHHHHHGPWGRHHGQFYSQQPGQPQAEPGGQPAPGPTPPEANTPQPTSWVNV